MKRTVDPLFAPTKKRHPAAGLLILFVIVVFAVTLVLNHINNSRVNLLTERVTVPGLPASLENYRILHISDLHGLYFGAGQERLALALKNARYNAVCVTGDITGPDGDIGAFLALLDLFQGKAPVYFITGDEDPPAITASGEGGGGKADYIRAAESHGGIYLDAPVKLRDGKNSLWLAPDWAYTLDFQASDAAYQAQREKWLAEPESQERTLRLAAVAYQMDQLARIRQARRGRSSIRAPDCPSYPSTAWRWRYDRLDDELAGPRPRRAAVAAGRQVRAVLPLGRVQRARL